MQFSTPLTLTLACLSLLKVVVNSYDNLPLKVFILAGQSNMVGSGAIDHLDKLTKEIPTHSSYNEFRDVLWNGASYEYETRDDVYVKFNEKHGQLTVGRDTGYASQACFGPELMFGWTVGDAMDETVLLIKTAWGGKDLAVDFRSPSSGQGNYLVDSTLYGQFYLAMIADVRNALENLSMYVPGYDERSGYILSGMVWFQGWNDMIRTSKVQEYESNLANFIRDVRFDLSAPDLPIVIGELGMHGPAPKGSGIQRVLSMRAAQKNVALMDEFKNNTRFVRTAAYAVLDGAKYDGIHHYNGRADTFLHLGRAFGEEILLLQSEIEIKRNEGGIQGPKSFLSQLGLILAELWGSIFG